MKKNVLTFIMLVLCTGIFTTKTFAQDVVGGSSDGLVDVSTGIAVTDVQFTQPANYRLNVTRNNGNGTSSGMASAYLHINGTGFGGDAVLVGIAWKSTAGLNYPVVMPGGSLPEKWAKGKMTFPLLHNIPPKNKLVFHFVVDGIDRWIPEM